MGALEDDPEYKLVVASNQLIQVRGQRREGGSTGFGYVFKKETRLESEMHLEIMTRERGRTRDVQVETVTKAPATSCVYTSLHPPVLSCSPQAVLRVLLSASFVSPGLDQNHVFLYAGNLRFCVPPFPRQLPGFG